MRVGRFCAKGNDRRATFTRRGGVLWHEEAGEIVVDRVRTTTSWNAGSNQETCWHQCKLEAPVEAQVNLRDILRRSHNEQMLRS